MKSRSFIEGLRSKEISSKFALLTCMLLLLCGGKAMACGGDYWGPDMCNHFSLVQPLDPAQTGVSDVDESVEFWYSYLGGTVSKDALKEAIKNAMPADYQDPANSENALVAALYKKGDNNAIDYLRVNNKLYKLNTWMNSWDYERPTDDQYIKVINEIAALQTTDKLAERIVYLRMRALYCAKRYDEVETNWNNYASKWKESPLKRRARGYMGGVYYQRGQYAEAIEIFDANGDQRSINKCVSRLLDPDKLEAYYQQNKNSRAIGYVIQDYANYIFHAMTNGGDGGDIWPQVRRDYDKMLAFAERVVKEKKVKDLAMWQDFVGFLYYSAHNDDKAYEAFCKVHKMKPTVKEKEFARYFKFLASFNAANRPDNFTDYLLAETENLLLMQNKQLTNEISTDDHLNVYEICDFDLPTRLYKYCNSLGNEQAKMLVMSIFQDVFTLDDDWCLFYNELIDHVWSADKVIEFYNKLQNPPAGDKLVAGLTKLSPADLTPAVQELIGTKLMREGKFDKAIPYLKDVPESLLKSQGIAPYLNLRTVSKRDFERDDYDEMDSDNIKEYRNVKLEFCQLMEGMTQQLLTSKGDKLADVAYEMANLCFQASPAGDLWALSEYSWSSADIHYNNLNQMAIDLLHLAIRNTNDFNRLKRCYYGLAAVPQREQMKFYYNWDTQTYSLNAMGSELEGYEWLAKNLPRNDELRRTCDWLNAYIESNPK